jgi:hypothetical protein
MATVDMNETKNSVTVNTPSGNANTEIATCRYSSKPCSNPRAIKKTGDLHSFCEFHRLMANRNQRRCEQKRRTKRQFEKVVRRRSVHPPGFQMLMAMDGVPPPAQPDSKHKRRRSASSVPSPTSNNGAQLNLDVPSIDTSELEALASLPNTIDPIAFQADIHTETELSLEPYSHPVELHDEDVQYLYMTVVESTDADTRDSESTSLVDAMYAFSV